jgi:hypothetical protein
MTLKISFMQAAYLMALLRITRKNWPLCAEDEEMSYSIERDITKADERVLERAGMQRDYVFFDAGNGAAPV